MEIKDKAGKVLSDPKTNNNMLFVIHIIVLIGTITFLIKNKKSKTKFLILGILLLPFIANAEKMYPLTINITYEVPGETCSKINNNQVKTIIKENIMTNPEFYAKKKATVENLKNSPNMPEQYKKYLIEDEVEGNPLCSRNELVQKKKIEKSTAYRNTKNIHINL